MSPVIPRATALPLLLLTIVTACSDGYAPTQPSAVSSSPLSAKQSTTASRMLYYDFVNIYVINDDGSNATALGLPADGSFDPSWAPDGKRVLFNSYRGSTQASIYIMDVDGTAVTRITNPPVGFIDVRPVTFGKRVAFTRAGATSMVYSVNLDGSELTPIATGSQPASSPSGAKLAFVNNDDIFEFDVATGSITNLTNTPFTIETDPSYSPNGKQIAFATYAFGGTTLNTLSVMAVNGTAVTRLRASATETYSLPKWSPDGKRIAYTGGPASDLFVMNADGTSPANITNSLASSEQLTAWAR